VSNQDMISPPHSVLNFLFRLEVKRSRKNISGAKFPFFKVP
jgi:hypothetical protein